jgi:hypothetical protein
MRVRRGGRRYERGAAYITAIPLGYGAPAMLWESRTAGRMRPTLRINDVTSIMAVSACISTPVRNNDAGHRRDGCEPEIELALD